MIYSIELKLVPANDTKNRMPNAKELKSIIDKYSDGNRGLVIGHDSFYDFQYDTMNTGYDTIDTTGAIGSIQSSFIEGDKLFLVININDNIIISDRVILFYRAKLRNTNKDVSVTLNSVELIVIDLINIRPTETIKESNLSIIRREEN